MGKPQQPELGRSGHTPVTEGQHAREVLQGQGRQRPRIRPGRPPTPTGPGTTRKPNRTSQTPSASAADWPEMATAEVARSGGGQKGLSRPDRID